LLVVTSADDAIERFLLTHNENCLKYVAVDELRRIIPKLFMYTHDHGAASCRKGLTLLLWAYWPVLDGEIRACLASFFW